MNNYIHPLEQHLVKQSLPNPETKESTKFKDVLLDVSKPKISKHAKARLGERNIELTDDNWKQISKKMNDAKQKGVKDALVVLDDVTLVVSTKNNTVITALNSKEATNKIFTNINGTIFI